MGGGFLLYPQIPLLYEERGVINKKRQLNNIC